MTTDEHDVNFSALNYKFILCCDEEVIRQNIINFLNLSHQTHLILTFFVYFINKFKLQGTIYVKGTYAIYLKVLENEIHKKK